jgi:hypothetical protein
MAKWQFRKSKSLFPGIRFNVGKRGIGLSAGVPGLRATISSGSKRVSLTQSIPGTGLRKTVSRSLVSKSKGAESQRISEPAYSSQDENGSNATWSSLNIGLLKTFLISASLTILSVPFANGGFAAFIFLISLVTAFICIFAMLKSHSSFRKNGSTSRTFNSNVLAFNNSVFFRGPTNLPESKYVIETLEFIQTWVKLIIEGKDDNSRAPEYPVKRGEVVLAKFFASLADGKTHKAIDNGELFITNKRLSFIGTAKSRDWKVSEIVTPWPIDDECLLLIRSSQFTTISGVKTSPDQWLQFQNLVFYALANEKGSEELLSQINTSLLTLRSQSEEFAKNEARDI